MINIISEQLWSDEGGTIDYVNSSWAYMFKTVTEEKNPILYYTILKLWISLFGDSVFSCRMLSVIFSVLTVPVLFLLGKEIKDEKLGLFIIFLYAISPFSIWYANEVRMYSMLQLLFTIALYFAVKLLKEPVKTKNYIYFSLTGVCMIYTHYIGVVYLVVLGVGIFLYNRKSESFYKNATSSVVIIICSYIPWIPYAIADFLGGPTAYTGGVLDIIVLGYWGFYFFVAPVPSYIEDPYVLNIIIYSFLICLPLVIISLVGFIGFLYSYINKDYYELKHILNYTILMTIFIFGIPILIGFLIPNTFQAKNLIGGLTLVHLIEAFGLYYLIIDKSSSFNQNLKKFLKIFNPKLFKRLFNPLIVIVVICSAIIFPIFKTTYLQKPDWNGCVKTLKKEFESDDIVINLYGANKLPEVMEYYCDKHDFDFEKNTYDLIYKDEDIEEFFEYVEEEGITRIWIVSYWKHVVDPDDKTGDELDDEYGYDLEKIEEYEFRLDIKLILYEVQPLSQ
ncbi:MAG: glycosyltransferase family 39 protein [Promethearchaeota archaeon]